MSWKLVLKNTQNFKLQKCECCIANHLVGSKKRLNYVDGSLITLKSIYQTFLMTNMELHENFTMTLLVLSLEQDLGTSLSIKYSEQLSQISQLVIHKFINMLQMFLCVEHKQSYFSTMPVSLTEYIQICLYHLLSQNISFQTGVLNE